jgi:hypothetical protein
MTAFKSNPFVPASILSLMVCFFLGPYAEAVSKIEWESLRALEDPQSVPANLKANLINENVSIVGYVIPLEYDGETFTKFLLTPVFVSCMHVPMPPPNQIIEVNSSGLTGFMPQQPLIEVRGKLTLNQTENAAYYQLKASGAREIKESEAY